MDELLQRIIRLEAAEASRKLACTYATALDGVDLELLDTLFTEDAVLEVPTQRFQGRAAVLGFFAEAFAAATVTKKHFMCNLDVEVTGPSSTHMSSYFLYTFAGQDTSVLGWGTYVDEVVIADGAARFRYKSISVDVHADVRAGWATT